MDKEQRTSPSPLSTDQGGVHILEVYTKCWTLFLFTIIVPDNLRNVSGQTPLSVHAHSSVPETASRFSWLPEINSITHRVREVEERRDQKVGHSKNMSGVPALQVQDEEVTRKIRELVPSLVFHKTRDRYDSELIIK